MKSIIHLLPSLYVGGAEIFAGSLNKSMANISIFDSKLYSAIPLKGFENSSSFKVVDLGYFVATDRFNRLRNAFFSVARNHLPSELCNLLIGCDVVHIHLPSLSYGSTPLLGAILKTNLNCVVTVHFCAGNERVNPIISYLIKASLLKKKLKIIAVGIRSKQNILNVLRIKSNLVQVIENTAFTPLSFARKLFKNEINYTFLSVGSFEPRKNQLYIIKVFDQIIKHISSSAHLTFYGNFETQYGLNCRQLVNDLNISAHVSFSGWNDDPNVIYGGSSFLITASLAEGKSLAIDEAMKRGLILVATRESIESFDLLENSEFIPINTSFGPSRETLQDLFEIKQLVNIRKSSYEKAWQRTWLDLRKEYIDTYDQFI